MPMRIIDWFVDLVARLKAEEKLRLKESKGAATGSVSPRHPVSPRGEGEHNCILM